MKINETAIKSRKMLRKEARKLKKQKRQEYYVKRGKRKKGQILKESTKSENARRAESNASNEKNVMEKNNRAKVTEFEGNFKNFQTRQDYDRESERKEKNILEEEMIKQRIENLKRDNLKEEKEIRKYEKKLKFRKGKRSRTFALEGLDYILDVCDLKSSENEGKRTFLDSDSEFESDLLTVTGKKKAKLSEKKNNGKVVTDETDMSGDSKSCLESTKDVKEQSDEEEASSTKYNSDSDKGEADLNNLKQMQNKKRKNFKKVRFAQNVIDNNNDDDCDYNCDGDNFDDDDDDNDNGDDDDCDYESDSDNENRIEEFYSGSDPDDDYNVELNEAKSKYPKENVKMDRDNAKKGDNLKKLSSSLKNMKNHQKTHSVECKNLKNTSNKDIQKPDLEKQNCKKSEIWEDIYGKLRDKEGNVINTYKPPHIRKIASDESRNKNKEKLLRLKRQLKGLLNRLAEANMASISNQIEELYMSNSRNDMNETLQELFSEAILVSVSVPERLITEHAMLIAILHANVGSEVGAYFLQFAVMQFDKLLKEDLEVENKHINNLMLFIMHLYNFQLFNSKLLYDMIYKLLENLKEKQIELILLALRTVGFSLRKDDPVALKSLVLKIQEKANANRNTEENYSRMKFMLEIVSAIKNNNVSKIPNYDPEYVEHLKKCMKVLIRKGSYKTELNISMQDLLNAEEHGRWWIIGSAWSGTGPNENNSKNVRSEESLNCELSFSQKLLDLAKKQRMNTDARKNVFCILMSAEDYLDAFEKLMKLGLKGAVEREIVNVLLHCVLQEKEFNPYYFHLANKLCIFDRKFQIMIQYSIWDKVKELNNLLRLQIVNLAKFVGNIILSKGLPLSILKIIQFSEMNKTAVKFIRQVLLTILMTDEETVMAVFSRVTTSPKLKIFRDGIRLFLHHFLIKNIKEKADKNSKHLIRMIDIADNILSSSDLNLIF